MVAYLIVSECEDPVFCFTIAATKPAYVVTDLFVNKFYLVVMAGVVGGWDQRRKADLCFGGFHQVLGKFFYVTHDACLFLYEVVGSSMNVYAVRSEPCNCLVEFL